MIEWLWLSGYLTNMGIVVPAKAYLCPMGQYSMQQALQQFIQKSKNKQAFQAMQLETVWETLMGKTVARYTDKIQIQGSKLFITTSVAPLKQELSYQKRKIIERVNEVLGDRVIDEVVIR